MSDNATLTGLRQREKTQLDKIARIKSGELKCEEYEGDGRQEAALLRNEKILRDIRKDITKEEDNIAKAVRDIRKDIVREEENDTAKAVPAKPTTPSK